MLIRYPILQSWTFNRVKCQTSLRRCKYAIPNVLGTLIRCIQEGQDYRSKQA